MPKETHSTKKTPHAFARSALAKFQSKMVENCLNAGTYRTRKRQARQQFAQTRPQRQPGRSTDRARVVSRGGRTPPAAARRASKKPSARTRGVSPNYPGSQQSCQMSEMIRENEKKFLGFMKLKLQKEKVPHSETNISDALK